MLRKISRLLAMLVILVNFSSSIVAAQTETIEELYKKALKEAGVLNCYCSLAQINAEKIYPVFEKRFPGIKINHVDATSDKLSARAITEARGGKTLADVVEFGLEDINKIHEQGLILDKAPPEAAAYPANLKGPYWTANNLIFFVGAWNTDKVKKEEEPKFLDDFGDPRWKGRLIAEPRDYEILIALDAQAQEPGKGARRARQDRRQQRRISQRPFAARRIFGRRPGGGVFHLLFAPLSRRANAKARRSITCSVKARPALSPWP